MKLKLKTKRNIKNKKNISRKDRFYQGGVQLNDKFLELLRQFNTNNNDPEYNLDFSNKNDIRAVAIEYFIDNSEIELLTNSSRNCVTLVASLKSGKISPFQSLRFDKILDDEMNIDIRKILIKVLITRKEIQVDENIEQNIVIVPNRSFIFKDNEKRIPGIAITSLNNYKNEVKTQMDVYRKSFVSKTNVLDPICPAILFMNEKITNEEFRLYINHIKPENEGAKNTLIQMHNRVHNDNTLSISTIYMEFMDGFSVASKILIRDDQKLFKENSNVSPIMQEFYFKCIQCEFIQLHQLGYLHGDAHFSNIMINQEYPYFFNGEDFIGCKLIIIDFDKTIPISTYNGKPIDFNNIVFLMQNILSKERFIEKEFLDPKYKLTKIEYDDFINKRLAYIEEILKPFILSKTPFRKFDDCIKYILNKTEFTAGAVNIDNNHNNIFSKKTGKKQKTTIPRKTFPKTENTSLFPSDLTGLICRRSNNIFQKTNDDNIKNLLWNMYNDPYIYNKIHPKKQTNAKSI